MKPAVPIAGLAVALAALGAAYFGLGWGKPSARSARAAAANPAARPATETAAKAPASAAAAAESRPVARIDAAFVRNRWPQWLNAPARDPFQAILPAAARKAAPESPVSRFQLLATWLQTGRRLAVIDKKVYGEGDQLADYRILTIAPGEVLVQGETKTERITFTSYLPAQAEASRARTNFIERWLGPEKEKVF
jgi:hypothetical protein